MKPAQLLLASVFAIILLGFGVWWQVYKYGDCLKVGHSKTYCIMSVGK